MLKYWLMAGLLAAAGVPTSAQTAFPGNIVPANRITVLSETTISYFGLTTTQLSQITQNLDDYLRLSSQRQQRIFQVQSEIQEETAKSPLNPMALGIRYAEIEAICRNVKDEATAAQKRNLALLTDAQAVKLKALEDALKLAPTINEAQQAGLLAPPGQYGYGQGRLGVIANFLPGFSATLSGCQQAVLYDPFSGSPLTQAPHVN
jgi:hypothetical protein